MQRHAECETTFHAPDRLRIIQMAISRGDRGRRQL